MSDERYAFRVLQRVEGLVGAVQRSLAGQPDAAAIIANLAGIYHGLAQVVSAQAHEIEHFARVAHEAELARDEAIARQHEAELELEQLRDRLAEGIAAGIEAVNR